MASRQRRLDEADKRAAAKLRALWSDYQKKNPGISQEVAAERAGMTQSAFSQFLKDRVPMRLGPVLKFAKLFKVEPTEIREDLSKLQYAPAAMVRKLEARSPELGGLTDDAIQVAIAFASMSPQTQDFIRDLVFTYSVIDKTCPWLRQGRPRSHNYAPWERWHQENYRAKLTLEAARIRKINR